MALIIRENDELGAEDTVLVHMGAGAVQSMVNAAILNYTAYATLLGTGRGAFTVSTYAVTDAVPERTIVMKMRHGQFARVRVEALRAADFDVLATTEADEDDEVMRRLQQVHYDIVLPVAGDPVGEDPVPAPSSELLDELAQQAARLLEVAGMAERFNKYDLYKEDRP